MLNEKWAHMDKARTIFLDSKEYLLFLIQCLKKFHIYATFS